MVVENVVLVAAQLDYLLIALEVYHAYRAFLYLSVELPVEGPKLPLQEVLSPCVISLLFCNLVIEVVLKAPLRDPGISNCVMAYEVD